MNHIVTISFNLLYDFNFDKLTVQKICDSAKINRSTFYRYFSDKYELLYYISQYIVELLYDQVHKTNYDSIFEALIYFIEYNKRIFENLLIPSRQIDIFTDLNQICSKLLKEQSYTNNDSLSISIRNSNHPQLLCDFYSSGILEVLKKWQQKKYNYTVEELVSTIKQGLDNINL